MTLALVARPPPSLVKLIKIDVNLEKELKEFKRAFEKDKSYEDINFG
jgi:hypothetical protein